MNKRERVWIGVNAEGVPRMWKKLNPFVNEW